jgi:hypothetical protein
MNNIVIENIENISSIYTSYKILMWNKFMGRNWNIPTLNKLNCEYSNCIVTENRDDLNESDAVVFHWSDVSSDIPAYHLNFQRWIIANWEPPSHISIDTLNELGDNINWTMTYRQDSDIFSPYGKFYKCPNNMKQKYKFDEKKKSIAWFVGHCDTQSKREIYVKELQKYIDVDIFGECGPLNCSKNNACYETVAKNYKFYLSFENSVSFLK